MCHYIYFKTYTDIHMMIGDIYYLYRYDHSATDM